MDWRTYSLLKEKRKAKKLDIRCHKCDKFDHYANQYWTKKVLNEIEDEQLRSQLEKVMLIISSESEQESSNEEDLELNYETSLESSSPDKKDCKCNEINCWKSRVDMNGLNVINADKKKTLKVIELITDPDLKKIKIKSLIKENKESPLIIEESYQLSEILYRFQQSNVKKTHVSIVDLRKEINLLKSEISQIKQNYEVLSTSTTRKCVFSNEITSSRIIPSLYSAGNYAISTE